LNDESVSALIYSSLWHWYGNNLKYNS